MSTAPAGAGSFSAEHASWCVSRREGTRSPRLPATDVGFMLQLSRQKLEEWRYQFGTSNPAARMSLRYRLLVFTEHGLAMPRK
ncbi:MAG TPA: ORF6N domain-containing protein [Gemmatimonadaceae bacterium]|nr:ORF6N domain-containing protein [Gemmatimonadaceae bacterium]